MDARTIEARTHGRYLVRRPGEPGPWPTVVGFHGYAESAAIHLDALAGIPGAERWQLVSIQALHRFYAKQERVAASWMTREDRELAIADNVDYVGRVLDALRPSMEGQPFVFAGFSQGGAMAYRAAAHYRCDGLIVLAADVPPDVASMPGVRLPPVLIGRGIDDGWYTEDKERSDLETLERLGAPVERCRFAGGHEWAPEFYAAAAAALERAAGADLRRPPRGL